MKSEKGCPFCREDIIEIVKSAPQAMEGLQVECDNCGARGPIYESKEEAIAGWEHGIRGLGGVRQRRS
jgi:Lar family restriction alleviation protein